MYEQNLKTALLGRTLRDPEQIGVLVYGSELGFDSSDVHYLNIYQVTLVADDQNVLTDLMVSVIGELISPCSGYETEKLDQFDWQPLLRWCERNLF